MANPEIRPCNPYHWQYRASAQYQKVYIALHLGVVALTSYALVGGLKQHWEMLACTVILIAAHGLWGVKQYLTMAANPLELSLNSAGVLQQLVAVSDGVRQAEPIDIVACRWMGPALLVVSLRPKGLSKLANIFGVKRRALVLWRDNSTAADRHRLAMFYHSGPVE